MKRSIAIIMHQHSSLSRWMARVHRLCTGRHFNIWTFQCVIQLPLWLPGGAEEYISDFDALPSTNLIILMVIYHSWKWFHIKVSESWGGSSGEGEGDSGFLTAESDSRSVRFSSSKDIQKVIYQERLPKSEIAAKTYKRQITHKFCPQPISVVILQLQKSTHV